MTEKSDCATCAIRPTGFCGQLDDQLHSAVADCARMVTLPAGKQLWDDHDPSGFVGVVQSGYLRFQRYGIDGRRQILCLLQPGDIIGDPQDHAKGYAVETATAVRICRFDERRFRQLMQQVPDVARSVYRMRSARLEQLRWLTWSLGVLSAEERLCAFFAMATRHMPFEPDGERGGRLTIRLPRPDIADLLATSVESISRISQKLAAEGLIAIISPGLFHIPDVQRLAQRGCLNDPAAAGSTQIKAAQRAPGLPMQDRVSQIA